MRAGINSEEQREIAPQPLFILLLLGMIAQHASCQHGDLATPSAEHCQPAAELDMLGVPAVGLGPLLIRSFTSVEDGARDTYRLATSKREGRRYLDTAECVQMLHHRGSLFSSIAAVRFLFLADCEEVIGMKSQGSGDVLSPMGVDGYGQQGQQGIDEFISQGPKRGEDMIPGFTAFGSECETDLPLALSKGLRIHSNAPIRVRRIPIGIEQAEGQCMCKLI